MRSLGLALLFACTPTYPESAPESAPSPLAPAPTLTATAPVAILPAACDTATCWLALADEAEHLGNRDVALAHRHRAHKLEPTPALQTTWIDGLIALGATRRARNLLNDTELAATLTPENSQKLAALPLVHDATLYPPPLTHEQRLAYTAERDGRLAEAAALLAVAHAGEPHHLAAAARLAADRGDWTGARRLWSTARTVLHHRGATIQLEPMERLATTTLAWHGDELLQMQQWSRIEDARASDGHNAAGVLRRSTAAGATTRPLYFPWPSRTLTITADGQSFVRDNAGEIFQHDLLSGAVQRKLATTPASAKFLVTTGTGDDLLVLVGGDLGVSLWDARASMLADFDLPGSTRVQTTVLAMTEAATRVAVGGDDGNLRIFDRTRNTQSLLTPDWPRVDVRNNRYYDNKPLAARFTAADRLVVVYSDGDIVTWDPAGGPPLHRHDGRCAREDWPHKAPPSDADLIKCGQTFTADLTPDGSSVLISSEVGYRVRDIATGATRQRHGTSMSLAHTALSPTGTLAVAEKYGAATVWRSDQPEPQRPPPRADLTWPRLSPDGQLFHFHHDGEHAWDLITRHPLALTRAPAEQLLAFNHDGTRAAIDTLDALEIRDATTCTTISSIHAADFSPDTALVGRTHALFIDDANKPATIALLHVGPDRQTRRTLYAEQPLATSEDGRWLATGGEAAPFKIRDLHTWKVLYTGPRGVEHAAFSRDSARIAWVAHTTTGDFTAHVRNVLGRPDEHTLRGRGWRTFIDFTPDDGELLLLGGDTFHRWQWATDRLWRREHSSLHLTRSAAVAPDGRSMWFNTRDAVEVRTNDESMRLLARIYPLRSGGWTILSNTGAVDGSDDAVESMTTSVVNRDSALTFDGWLGWDAASVPGTPARALAGEDVRPPIVTRAPTEI